MNLPPASVAETVSRLVREAGTIDFATYMDVVLYGEGGFFSTSPMRASRRGDFVTSPELGAVFAEHVVRAITAWADEVDVGEVVHVADVGGGRGTLAAQLRDAWADSCAGRRCEVAVVETSPGARQAATGSGVRAVADVTDLPWRPEVIIANELLDNLPARLVAVDARAELRVGLDDGELVWYRIPLDAELEGFVDEFTRSAPTGGCGVVPVPTAALGWLRQVDAIVAPTALMLLVDFGALAPELAARTEWPLRAYHRQRRVDPLFGGDVGTDVTVDVPVDVVGTALDVAGWTTRVETQREWLVRYGGESTIRTARIAGDTAAREGDHLLQLAAKSRLIEARALMDGAGLGAFFVLQATRG